MKQTMQNGFTLIELMIVVAIIGILAAVALPAFQDYTTKAKLAEITTMSAPARTAIGLACSEGSLPAAATSSYNTSLGLPTSTAISSTYVFSVVVDTTTTGATITVASKYDGSKFGTATGQTVIYTGTCNPPGIRWEITGGTLNSKFRPKT